MFSPYSAPGCFNLIISIIAEYRRVNSAKLSLKTRQREIVQTRQLAMFFMNKCTCMTLNKIAETFAPAVKNHSTVIHAVKTVKSDLSGIEYNWHFKQIEAKILKAGYVYRKEN